MTNEYRAMVKNHHDALVKIAEDAKDWDYGWLIEFTNQYIRNLYEYHTRGENVLCAEPQHSEIVKSLEDAIDIIEIYENSVGTIYEEKATKELFAYIGEHIMEWWD